ncbi:hypothetical protein B0H10DRAFT_2111225 [Mycena sp. CBHHK59/15]|nr:hypothetical protein B0H10DRAFT_2111225 [Mycena sp. CBHHK59/15]
MFSRSFSYTPSRTFSHTPSSTVSYMSSRASTYSPSPPHDSGVVFRTSTPASGIAQTRWHQTLHLRDRFAH